MSWPIVKLSDVAFFQEGPGVRKWQFRNEGIKLINVKNIVDEVLVTDNSDKYLDPDEVEQKYSHFLTKVGDLVMASSGATWGKLAWVEEKHLPLCMNTSMIRFQSLDSDKLDIRYLFYYLKTVEFRRYMEKLVTGSAQPNFGSTHLKQISLPLPPIEVQKRIAAILDKADAIRQKRKQAIDLADEFLRSVFLEMFGDPVTNPKGWEFSTLNNFGSFKNGMNFSKDEVGNQLYCVGVGDFKSFDRICGTSRLSTINLNEIPDKGYLLKDNDLLFVRSNGNKALVGRCVTVHPRAEEVTFSGFCIRYRIELVERLDADFVNYCLRIPSMKHAMLKGGQGANIQNINQQILSNLQIPIPPIELQKKYATLVASFRALQEKLTSNQLAAQEAFNSLSQKAFSGQL
ncbi:restriction endonuclease subunit S [Photobacterium damselae]|uniref:restriction endonuclease subunit S n=1 Tax=Photobacterium damselae TaxID=38293 RepID=UPI001EED3523|nr:restriction endonuclease subunit S [Photobacterium damselae]UKA04326.1 restriction endonuclease subunit S [Photobacterium damselae subsp. damselae]